MVRIPNVKKLGVRYEEAKRGHSMHPIDLLRTLSHLEQLEDIRFYGYNLLLLSRLVYIPKSYDFPPKLKKLKFLMTWMKLGITMTILGRLPNLEVLQLNYGAFDDFETEWEQVEEGFPKLKVLVFKNPNLRRWKDSDFTFPSLECLVLNVLRYLESLPYECLSGCPCLKLIDLKWCDYSVLESAKKIQNDGDGQLELRYLALYIGAFPSSLSILSSLKTLQTLILRSAEPFVVYSTLPKAPQLRKLCILNRSSLHFINEEENLKLENLTTLSWLSDFCCNNEALMVRIPNVKKLGVRYEEAKRGDSMHPIDLLHTLSHLEQLEDIRFYGYDLFEFSRLVYIPKSYDFPPKLKKLKFAYTRMKLGITMTILGRLPNLEVLKLKLHAFDGSETEWEQVEEGFPKLKVLVFEDQNLCRWIDSDFTFPSLECLVLNDSGHLESLPYECLSGCPCLKLIHLKRGCSDGVLESSKKIQNDGDGQLEVREEHIEENGNNKLSITCSSTTLKIFIANSASFSVEGITSFTASSAQKSCAQLAKPGTFASSKNLILLNVSITLIQAIKHPKAVDGPVIRIGRHDSRTGSPDLIDILEDYEGLANRVLVVNDNRDFLVNWIRFEKKIALGRKILLQELVSYRLGVEGDARAEHNGLAHEPNSFTVSDAMADENETRTQGLKFFCASI
nr:putative late blight resistance protein homolog R1A-4 [Ipomoea batatas]